MKKILLFLTILIFNTAVLIAREVYPVFSVVGPSASTIAMGNIYGFSAGASSVFENPASLKWIDKASISVFHTKFFDEVEYRNLALATRTSFGVISIGYMDAGVEGFISTEKNGNDRLDAIGTFDYKDTLIKLGYQANISKKVSFGLASSYYIKAFDTVEGTGFNADAGIYYDTNRFDVSFVFRNFLSSASDFTYRDDETELDVKDTLETDYLLGSKFRVNSQLEVLAQIQALNKDTAFSYGAVFTPSVFSFVQVRAGKKQYFATTSEKIESSTVGFNVHLVGINLGYAYEESDYLAANKKHYFSVDLAF